MRRCRTHTKSLGAYPVVLLLVDRNRVRPTEVLQAHTIGLSGAPGRERREECHGNANQTDLDRNVGRAGWRDGCKDHWKESPANNTDIMRDGSSRYPNTGREEFRPKARENGIVALVDDAPPDQRHGNRRRDAADAD